MKPDQGIKPDSTAFSLSIKNFGHLPKELNARWSSDFYNIKNKNIPMPKRLIVELLNSCNFDCPMCRVGRYGVNFNRALPYSLFITLLDQVNGQVREIRLNGLGESTLLPDFVEYAKAVVERKMSLELISNGSGSVEDYLFILQNHGILFISWDAAGKDLFERLRRPANFDTLVGKIKLLAKEANKMNVGSNFFLLFTLQPSNFLELPKLVQSASEWGIQNILINVAKLPNQDWIRNNSEEIRSAIIDSNGISQTLGLRLIIPEQIGGIELDIPGALKTSSSDCKMPFEEAVIRWNGDVQVCNMFNPFTYGNINLCKFKDIWSNSFATLFRSKVNTDQRHSYCIDCVYINEVYNGPNQI